MKNAYWMMITMLATAPTLSASNTHQEVYSLMVKGKEEQISIHAFIQLGDVLLSKSASHLGISIQEYETLKADISYLKTTLHDHTLDILSDQKALDRVIKTALKAKSKNVHKVLGKLNIDKKEATLFTELLTEQALQNLDVRVTESSCFLCQKRVPLSEQFIALARFLNDPHASS